MKKSDIFVIIALIAIGGYLSFGISFIFTSFFQGELSGIALSAFAGAFFAFIFAEVAHFFAKLYQRKVKHYNSLVMLSTQLNNSLNTIGSNEYLIPFFINAITTGLFYRNSLHILEIDESHFAALAYTDFINELFEYYTDIRKLNYDISSLNEFNKELKDAYKQKAITIEEYILNAKQLAKDLSEIALFISHIDSKTKRLLAIVRLMMEMDMPLGTRIMNHFIVPSRKKIMEDNIVNELQTLDQEIETIRAQSRKELDEIANQH